MVVICGLSCDRGVFYGVLPWVFRVISRQGGEGIRKQTDGEVKVMTRARLRRTTRGSRRQVLAVLRPLGAVWEPLLGLLGASWGFLEAS